MDDNRADDAAPQLSTDVDNLPHAPADDGHVPAIPAKNEESVQTSTQHASVAITLQGVTDKALEFLSHASNETLGACLAGLGATTYLVLGRVGLVIIGVAGGIVLHATWDGLRGDNRDEETKRIERERRREVGVEVAKRVLDWRQSKVADDGLEDVKVNSFQQLDYSTFEPETAKALEVFTNAVIKDYVYYWYGPTLPGEESFPASCKRTLTAFILSLSSHLQRKRPSDTFLDFVTNASSIIVVFLNELSAAMNASPNSSAKDAISTYLELKPDSSLSYVLDHRSQSSKLGDIAEDILQAYVDPKAYNCPPVHMFLKEVLAQLVLGSTITLCSRPEWINEWIVYGLEESETTKEVMDIVDAGVEGRDTQHLQSRVEQKALPHEVKSKKEGPTVLEGPVTEHKRQLSRAEEAMDEAMREAKRLTQLMIEEDEKRAREDQRKQVAVSSSEDVSDGTTHGVPTPTSSQSDQEATTWSQDMPVAESTAPVDQVPVTPDAKQQFTNFDQLIASTQPLPLNDSPDKSRQAASFTLHNANISIFDDSQPGERASIKAKPTTDYLIQIEPSSSAFAGWMIARKYADFENLHEVLRRISVITGVVGFAEAHSELPKWRVHTKASLRSELERYLTDAMRFAQLAESEGMKRFLEKEQAMSKSPGAGKGFGWPTPDAFGKLGGDMMNVLTKAPKQVAGGVAGGGKAVLGGVAGLVGGKKANQSQSNLPRTTTTIGTATESPTASSRTRQPSMGQPFPTDSYLGSMSVARESQDSLRAPTRTPFDRKASTDTSASLDSKLKLDASSQRSSVDLGRSVGSLTELASPATSQAPLSPNKEAELMIQLPPPPSEMPEEYGSPTGPSGKQSIEIPYPSIADRRPSKSVDSEALPRTPSRTSHATEPRHESKPKPPLSHQETSVAIELMFAVITELYTLSSAWNIRRTLLTAAKTFLLRPGNPQLAAIRELLQTSLLDANLSDSGLAAHIYKLRENALPTAEELEIWKRDYPEKTPEQKEELRIKARELLVKKGMPQALSSVMGAAASGEALGKVFDCLQVPDISRGLVFGLMLQALRVVTH